MGASITSFTWTPVQGFNAGPPITITRNVPVNVIPPLQRPPIRGDVIINQFYGHGATPNDNAVSHGFIELYNTTNAPISLTGYSLQVQIIGNDIPANTQPAVWHTLNLNGRTIPANRSFLVVSSGAAVNNNPVAGHTPRYTIPNNAWDMTWNLAFSDRNMSVALVHSTEALTNVFDPDSGVHKISDMEEFGRVVDLVGVQRGIQPHDRAQNYYGAARTGVAQYTSARRINFQNNWRNNIDFETRDFRFPRNYAGNTLNRATSDNGMTNEQLQQFRPRHSGEPNWASVTRQTVTATVTGAPLAEVVISPEGPRVATTTMTLTVIAPSGQRFAGAAGSPVAVTGAAGNFNLTISLNRSTATGTFSMPAASGALTVTATFQNVTFTPSVVINQMYGRSFENGNAVSHGFIELYNPTAGNVNLAGHSLQVQNLADGRDGGNGVTNAASEWEVLNFSTALGANTIMPSRTSLLIVTSQSNTNGASYVINPGEWDAVMPNNMVFSNRNFSAAIVSNTTRLPITLTEANMANIIDLVGAWNENDGTRDRVLNFWGASPAWRISNQQAVRRKWVDNGSGTFTLQNTRRNSDDFEDARYGGEDEEAITIIRPRRRANGAWSYAPPQRFTVTPTGTIAPLSVITPSGAQSAGTQMTLTITAPIGQRFTAAAGANVSVTGLAAPFNAVVSANRLTAVGTFTMPDNNRNITASPTFQTVTVTQGLVINQMYGRAFDDYDVPPAVNRGFIEIYNPTSGSINLAGLSLQVQNVGDGSPWNVDDWQVLNLTGSLGSRRSFLVVTQQNSATGARYTIPNLQWDAIMPNNMVFSNRNFSAAIVQGTGRLSKTVSTAEQALIIDMVGAWNNDNGVRDRVENFLGTAPAHRISNQEAVRRKWNWISASSNYVIQNSRRNVDDFESARFSADGMSDAELTQTRPRWSGDPAWERSAAQRFEVSVTGTAAAQTEISPDGTQFAGMTMTVTVTAPTGQRFVAGANSTISVTGLASPFNLTVAANRLFATGTFEMPAQNRTITVNASFENIPQDTRPVLVSMVHTSVTATAEGTSAATSNFRATGGEFANQFRLTAWENNNQVRIGFDGTNRTPVVFNHGFSGLSPWTSGSTTWRPSRDVGVANAPAFQLQFPTTGYNNISFTARQKSTSSGPDAFFLAYRIGTTGTWTTIPGSEVTPRRVGDDTYAALNHVTAETYVDFPLPSALNNLATGTDVFLRVVFNGANGLNSGNTSINNIEIRGSSLDNTSTHTVTFDLAGGNIGGNTANVVRTNVPNNGAATPPANPVRAGFVFAGWEGNFTTVTSTRTVTAIWHRLGALSSGGLGNVTSADAVWLARSIAGHTGFELPIGDPRRRIANMAGADRDPQASDITRLVQWLVGYDLQWLVERTPLH
jgi:hypothetical protein